MPNDGPTPASSAPAAGATTRVDPVTWLVDEGQAGTIPFRNTIRDALPDELKALAANYTDQWPDAAYLPASDEVATTNGGHQVYNTGAVVYSSLRTLTHEARNRERAPTLEAAMPGDGMPNADGVLKTMHGYNGYVCRRARWGFGPDLFVTYTFYRDGGGYNPLGFYRVDAAYGGADVAYRGAANRHLWALGNYPVAAEADCLKGFFVGDKEVSPYQAGPDGKPVPTFAFVRGDLAPPDTSWPNPVDQWASPALTVDEDRKLLIAVAAKGLNIVDLDASRDSYRKLFRVALVGMPAGVECDRAGFTWLSGKGIVGVHRVDANEAIGLQIRLGADPLVDAATVHQRLRPSAGAAERRVRLSHRGAGPRYHVPERRPRRGAVADQLAADLTRSCVDPIDPIDPIDAIDGADRSGRAARSSRPARMSGTSNTARLSSVATRARYASSRASSASTGARMRRIDVPTTP